MTGKTLNKAMNASDDVGTVMGALLTIAGVFDLAARLDITADELAMAIGAIFAIAAAVRGRFEKKRRAEEG